MPEQQVISEAAPRARLAPRTVRLIGCLSFYDESPAFLAAAISSLARVEVDHLVAVDGAYALLPGGRASSGIEQQQTIAETALACGMGLSLHVPETTWAGDEVEKRSFMFALAETVAHPNQDWYFVMDADQVVSHPINLKAQLAQTGLHAAEATFWEQPDTSNAKAQKAAQQFVWPRTTETQVRILFRAIPGLRVEGNHWTYVTPDGRKLWGNEKVKDGLEPALDLTSLRVEHRTNFRDKARRKQQYAYYSRRSELATETPPCDKCGQAPGVHTLGYDFRLEANGLDAAWTQVCDDCEPIVQEKNRKRLEYYRPILEANGVKPEDLEHYGVRALAPS